MIGDLIYKFGFLILILIFLVFIIGILYKNVSDSKFNVKAYSNFSNVFLIIGFIFLVITSFRFFNNNSNKNNFDDSGGFTIEKFDVRLNVSENNIVDVDETIVVNFYEDGHHGIYRFIPYWLEYTNKENKTFSRKSVVKELKASEYKYTVEKINDKELIKIGSSYETLDKGIYSYNISYQYDMGSDPNKGYDEFIFHAYGDYWNTIINNATIEITMPKSIDLNNVNFFSDKYRKNNINKFIDYYIEDNTIYAKISNYYSLDSDLTIDIDLPDNYFVNSSNNYGYLSILSCLMIIILFVVNTIKNIMLLTKKNQYLINENFDIINKYDSASIGYLYKGESGKKLLVSLILDLYSKGYVEIDKIKDSQKCIIIKKEDNISNLSLNEQLVYKKLFRDGDVNEISKDKKFYTVFNEITENLHNEFDEKINDVNSYKHVVLSSSIFVISSIYYFLAICFFRDLNPIYNFLYIVSLILILLLVPFIFIFRRKNSFGNSLIKQINILRENIYNYCQSNDIEQNILNFKNLLPYAYIFGISNMWIDKFKDKLNNIDSFNISYINDLNSDIYFNSSSSSSSSGCSSCGGGCSSCGGGGSW